MAYTDQVVFLAGFLLTLSILASIPAERSGVPVLVIFLVLGMLAGEQGLGGVQFEDVATAHLLGTMALAVILFDGGLHTPLSSFRTGLGPGLSLATAGVVATALITAGCVVLLYGDSWLNSLLLVSIISSTDAAAVFYLLRARGLELHPRVRNTLEIESGVNDPIAIFLTIILIEWVLQQHQATPTGLLVSLGQQLIGGAALGGAGGALLTWVVNRLPLPASLYPLLALSGGLLIYGVSASIGGSGFLAAYLAGLILGNRARLARRSIQRFHDGIAWLCQIGLFLMLGLLVTPSDLLQVAPKAVLVAGAIIVLGRPLAVALCLLPFRFPWRQVVFISWVGIRGAVPIVLSLFPLLAGVPGAVVDFNIIFFIVLISLLLQGWTVAPLARWLSLQLPRLHPDARWIDLGIPSDHELVICELPPQCPALNAPLDALRPPNGVQLLALVRQGRSVPVTPQRALQARDLLYLLVPSADSTVQERFDHWLEEMGTQQPESQRRFYGEFTIEARSPIADFAAIYLSNPITDARPSETIGDYLNRRLHNKASEGDLVELGNVVLVVREMDQLQIVKVGVKLPRPPAS
ncbi:MAG: potassium/proton antiporter [Nitrococcus mobilis]|nr:potassium/proton antiporter [Nitrococcus mobilis]